MWSFESQQGLMSSNGHSRSNKFEKPCFVFFLCATCLSSHVGVHLLLYCVSCFVSVQTQITPDWFLTQRVVKWLADVAQHHGLGHLFVCSLAAKGKTGTGMFNKCMCLSSGKPFLSEIHKNNCISQLQWLCNFKPKMVSCLPLKSLRYVLTGMSIVAKWYEP